MMTRTPALAFVLLMLTALTLLGGAQEAEAASTGRIYLVLKNTGVGSFSSTRQIKVYARQTDSLGGSRTAYSPRYGTASPGATFLAEFTYGLTAWNGYQGTYRFEVSFEDSEGLKQLIMANGTRLTGTDTLYVSRCGVSTRQPGSECAFDVANEAPPTATSLRCYPDPNGPGTGMYVYWSATPRPADYRNVQLQRQAPGASSWRTVLDTYTWGSQHTIDGGLQPSTGYRYRVVTFDRYGASATSQELPCQTEAGDLDGDGYLAPADCDDRDASIHPGAFDIPGDGEDQDCDGFDAEGLDADGDGIEDALDGCPEDFDPGQEDLDGDGLGDVCDGDLDGDGVDNNEDGCPRIVNPGQEDLDGDGLGDVCDGDLDGDGVGNDEDGCPEVADPLQLDLDLDGQGDACDADDDGDGVDDEADNCPVVANAGQEDLDLDGLGDVCDDDDDDDGVEDLFDGCPRDFDPAQYDLDGDGVGDVCDVDADGDGVEDGLDNCLGLANADQIDVDADGIGDACDPLIDRDGDGVDEATDNCPLVPNAGQEDLDGDGIGDACDADVDDDGVENEADRCVREAAGPADFDRDGCADTACDLADYIASRSAEELDPRLSPSLVSKADNACASATSGRLEASRGQLSALLNEVRAQAGRKISEGLAATLFQMVEAVLEGQGQRR